MTVHSTEESTKGIPNTGPVTDKEGPVISSTIARPNDFPEKEHHALPQSLQVSQA